MSSASCQPAVSQSPWTAFRPSSSRDAWGESDFHKIWKCATTGLQLGCPLLGKMRFAVPFRFNCWVQCARCGESNLERCPKNPLGQPQIHCFSPTLTNNLKKSLGQFSALEQSSPVYLDFMPSFLTLGHVPQQTYSWPWKGSLSLEHRRQEVKPGSKHRYDWDIPGNARWPWNSLVGGHLTLKRVTKLSQKDHKELLGIGCLAVSQIWPCSKLF